MDKKINYINEYLKEKLDERTLKIWVNGDYSCPNIDGSKA